MNPLATFAILIATAKSLVAAVTTRDNLHIRPAMARKAVAARLVSGLRVLSAVLRPFGHPHRFGLGMEFG